MRLPYINSSECTVSFFIIANKLKLSVVFKVVEYTHIIVISLYCLGASILSVIVSQKRVPLDCKTRWTSRLLTLGLSICHSIQAVLYLVIETSGNQIAEHSVIYTLFSALIWIMFTLYVAEFALLQLYLGASLIQFLFEITFGLLHGATVSTTNPLYR